MIRLVDAAGDTGAGLAGEAGGGQAEDMAEGDDDEISLHGAGDFGAEVVRAEREEAAGGADEEE